MTHRPPAIFWGTGAWAEAVAALPVQRPLPCRTVLVQRERVAHALRRELLLIGRADALAGTRFVTPLAAAAEVLRAADVLFMSGEEGLRTSRLLALFQRGLVLEHFSLDLLQSRPGWDEAFARTIGDLEAAGLRPDDLDAMAHATEAPARVRDVASVWRAIDESAKSSWTSPRTLCEAAKVLEANPVVWPFTGATLATVASNGTAAEARFMRAIPSATLAVLGSRPVRSGYLDRMRALFGEATADALNAATAPRSHASERDILASYLFESPSLLADPARPRSCGPDGTVDLEEHAGVEEEIEVAADWVARRVLAGTRLEDIAVLVPALDPLAELVAQRLQRLPWLEGTLPVHVAGGLPLTGTAAGARALAVVRALRVNLAGQALAEVLPALRADGDGDRHLSLGRATDLTWSLGTAGGSAARPQGALEWAERAASREASIGAQLERAKQSADDPDNAALVRSMRDLGRLLDDLRAVRPALDALVAVARLALGGATLATLWPLLREFLARWLLQPGEGARVHTILDERLSALTSDSACGTLTGDDALRVLEDAALTTRLPTGRFGEPAVYVGTVHGAVGLPFSAVRVIGLAEGHLPSVPREDPVLSDSLRAQLGRAMPTAADHVLDSLHALDAAVRAARHCVVLSVPRMDVERSEREPASVVLEAAAALGRPDATTEAAAAVIPDLRAVRRDAFAPARRASVEHRLSTPLGAAAWREAVTLRAVGVPTGWLGEGALGLTRIRAILAQATPGAMDGLLGELGDRVSVPGLTRARPISASALEMLLRCPHQFFLARILYLDEPTAAPTLRKLDQLTYGSLFHRVAEEFFRAHGIAFLSHAESLPAWRERADPFVERAFAELLEAYPLVGDAVRNVERERLRGDLHQLLDHEWNRGPARFVAAEQSFGQPDPVELALGSRSLFLRGRIDRLEVADQQAVVRDLKTGRAHPRTGKEAGPDHVRDVQIAVYGLVARQLARQWGVPARVGAGYVYVSRGVEERDWLGDFQTVLEPQAREWLDVAAGLLEARAFPRTSRQEDCAFCAFASVCGDTVYDRAAGILATGAGPLPRLAALKGAGPDGDAD
jgi:RecB family exonuclease